MYPNSREVKPLNWGVFVDETLRRRKAEKLTQREHAALANVSIPTMADFERGETSLTLAKAFDIMRVVGLFEEVKSANHQDVFVQNAHKRWNDLVNDPSNKLPEDSPVRFPHEYFRFDYYLEGVKPITPKAFCKIAKKCGGTTHHNASLWTWEDENRVTFYENDTIECWQPDQGIACRDFWWGSSSGRMFLMRGYHEDHGDCGYEGVEAGTVIDPTVHIRRMVQALILARNLATHMPKNNEAVVIHFRALYTGLNGRILRSIFDDSLTKGYAARSRETTLEVSVPIDVISNKLGDYLYPLAVAFYGNFGAKINRIFFQEILDQVK